MQGWHDTIQIILQILSNPAWSGISSICALVGIPLTIYLAGRSKTRQPHQFPHLSEKFDHYSSIGSRVLLKDGYHRALQVKDLETINSTNMNRYLSPKKKLLK